MPGDIIHRTPVKYHPPPTEPITTGLFRQRPYIIASAEVQTLLGLLCLGLPRLYCAFLLGSILKAKSRLANVAGEAEKQTLTECLGILDSIISLWKIYFLGRMKEANGLPKHKLVYLCMCSILKSLGHHVRLTNSLELFLLRIVYYVEQEYIALEGVRNGQPFSKLLFFNKVGEFGIERVGSEGHVE